MEKAWIKELTKVPKIDVKSLSHKSRPDPNIVSNSDDMVKETFTTAIGWTGAYVGAETLGAAGAQLGTRFGPKGVIAGGFVGGLVGGIIGYAGYYNTAEVLYGD